MYEKPIFCSNICKTAIWGGNNLSKIFEVNSPYEKTSEIWTVSAHKNGETPITIPCSEESTKLSEFYKADTSKEIFGMNCRKYEEFPLLIKWIDANDKLSVQVHPDDSYAKEHHNSFGKTEAWFIVSAKPGAQIVYGLKPGTTKEDLKSALFENRVEDVLNFVPVKEGDIFYIPSGMVHALLEGVVVYEVQQSSDITYRLYDWNRVDKDGNPRELHVKEALDVINFDSDIDTTVSNISVSDDEEGLKTILSSNFFDLRIRKVKGCCNSATSKSSFKLCSILKGNITIGNDSWSRTVKAGESFILPAAEHYVGGCNLYGEATILEAFVK